MLKTFDLISEQQKELKRLSLVAKHTHNGVVITDENERITWVNTAFTTLTGYSLEEAIGKNPGKLLQGPNTSAQTRQKIREHLDERKPVSVEILNYRKDGSEHWIKMDINPIFEDGIFSGYVAIQVDITERVEALHRIKESEDRLDAAVQGADLGVWELCVESGENIVNGYWFNMLGYKRNEIDPNISTFFELLHPEDHVKIYEVFTQLNDGEDTFDLLIRLRHKQGHYLIIRDRGHVISRNADGKVKSIIGTHLDITKEKKLECELNSSLNEKTILLQEVHHRVKNNLAIITGLLHLQALSVESDDVGIFYEEMSRRIKSIADVHEMLYTSESFSFINFKAYINKLVSNIMAISKNIITPEVLVFIDDSYQININQAIPLGLLFNELLTNSVKHAFPDTDKPVITFSMLLEGDYARCVYRDNGIGYETGDLSHSGFGHTLIETLLDQLGASPVYSNKDGFGLEFAYPIRTKGAHSMM